MGVVMITSSEVSTAWPSGFSRLLNRLNRRLSRVDWLEAPLKHVVYPGLRSNRASIRSCCTGAKHLASTPFGLIVTLTALDLFAKARRVSGFCFLSSPSLRMDTSLPKYVRSLLLWLPQGALFRGAPRLRNYA